VEANDLKDVQQDRSECIQNCVSSILSGVDYKEVDGIQTVLKMQTQKVITKQLIGELINKKLPEKEPEKIERIQYNLTLRLTKKIDQLTGFYIPPSKVVFSAYHRLSIPALIGAIVFGLFFYYALGSFFKDPLFAPLIGMPLGAGIFVWLFSKAIKHPKISNAVKWTLVSGLTVFSIGTLFSGFKKSTVFKPQISFFQWIWVAILTIFTFWTLHLFKPQVIDNEEEIERSLSVQLNSLLIDFWDLCMAWVKQDEIDADSEKAVTPASTTYQLFKNSPLISSSIYQMLFAHENQDKEAAFTSVNSFLNSLHSLGIHEKESEPVFNYQKTDADYYDVFGIIHEGEAVEPIYGAWVDDQGYCVFKGKVKKVRK